MDVKKQQSFVSGQVADQAAAPAPEAEGWQEIEAAFADAAVHPQPEATAETPSPAPEAEQPTAAAVEETGPGGPGQPDGEAVEADPRERNLAVVLGVPVRMQVVLGSASMPVASLLKLGRGAVVELDHKIGEPVEVTVNDRVVARGEVVVVEDDRFGVTLTEIVSSDLSAEGLQL